MTAVFTTSRWAAISAAATLDEQICVDRLRTQLTPLANNQAAISRQAKDWIDDLRATGPKSLGIEALLLEYRLDTPEGIALMCLAEALLRVPDTAVADALIRDLLSPVAWREHLGHSPDFFVNAATWGLALTGRWLSSIDQPDGQPHGWMQRISARIGEPALRQALKQAMRFLAGQFVLGENLDAALQRAQHDWQHGFTHSFDMLGEAALTTDDSERYFAAYRAAVDRVARSNLPAHLSRPSVSIKLSALHPRYHSAHIEQLRQELLPELIELCERAAAQQLDLTIDAEEADRLELSLQLFAELLERVDKKTRTHIGLVVQAYNKRALAVLEWLHELAMLHDLQIKVRLVKGAYWDSEIKKAQQRGLSHYPVFTQKAATDLSYLACAHWLLQHPQHFFPQFATHNAVSVAAIIAMAPSLGNFEMQRLQGMGEALYARVRSQYPALRCRIYAPVGEHRELLPYLVRRLLENGANTSFIHQLFDEHTPAEQLAQHPLDIAQARTSLPLPENIFQPERINSPGIDFHNTQQRALLFSAIRQRVDQLHDKARAIPPDNATTACNPATQQRIGHWQPTDPASIATTIALAQAAQREWASVDIAVRATLLEKCAEKLIQHRAELIALIVQECGKTIDNAHDEIREAVDFCRYYAAQARALLHQPRKLPGPVGETNELQLRPRGVFVCISPWNFPLAIFVGQIAAALVTGNAVIAKPAEQATLTALRVTELMHAAGIPDHVLQTLPGDGETIGAALCANENIDGIVFTGGLDTARAIQRQLAQRSGAIIPFIAETAGLNCLIADSSAQPQQLVADVIRSAFDSAGQRCSALRVLYLPDSCAEQIESLLIGAMRTLHIGDPLDWQTDIGPVIDRDARDALLRHIEQFRAQGRVIFQCDQTPTTGWFIPPTVIRLNHLRELTREAFGPVLHIIRYRAEAFATLADDINASGFGLTCGIHSRNQQRAFDLATRLRVGNCYINRDIIGAVVGVQPFGGTSKSGTGPKAGGPFYLQRFMTEQCITINTAAIGGDSQLLAGDDRRR